MKAFRRLAEKRFLSRGNHSVFCGSQYAVLMDILTLPVKKISITYRFVCDSFSFGIKMLEHICQQTFTCSESIETLEKGAKYSQN